MIRDYLLWNWTLILILAAFAISLKETVFLDKTTIKRMHILIVAVFLLSIVVYTEFHLIDMGQRADIRMILMTIRYSATPFILALIIYTLIRKFRWEVFIPAILLAGVNICSVFTGLVFSIGEDGGFHRGPLGLLPYVTAGAYCVLLIALLVRRSNKKRMEIIPICFLGFALASGLVLPFVLGREYSKLFCTTIAVALYVYYEFSILLLTKKDALTGLLNRQAFYADVDNHPETITALISIDMNGLKSINDKSGHTAGDNALTTLASCFQRALRSGQLCYRIGGDEFIIVCRRTLRNEMQRLVERIRQNVSRTEYSCSIGYSHKEDGSKTIGEMLEESDNMMYADKSNYYRAKGLNRRA